MGIFAVAVGLGEEFLSCMLATIFHEYAHFFVATKLGMEITSAKMTPFGGMIEIPLAKYPWQASLAVIVAGGLANLFLAVLLCGLWWFFPVTYGVTYNFAKANITIAMVNFLPCYPLDGGRGAYLWCKEILNLRNSEKIISLVGVALGAVFVVMFFVAKGNLTLLTLGVFMLIGSEKTLKSMSQITALEKWDLTCRGKENIGIKQENVLVASGETEVYKVFFHFKRGGENILKIRLASGKQITATGQLLSAKMISYKGGICSQTTLNELFCEKK
ncbi:MAG: hypothetical protein R3Y45_00025 [Bacillota bacterium]